METKNIVFAMLAYCYHEFTERTRLEFDYLPTISRLSLLMIKRQMYPSRNGDTNEKAKILPIIRKFSESSRGNNKEIQPIDDDIEVEKYIRETYVDEQGLFKPVKALEFIKSNYPEHVASFWTSGKRKRIYKDSAEYEYFYSRIKEKHLDYYSVFEEMGINELEADEKIALPAYKKAMAVARKVLLVKAQATYAETAETEKSLVATKEVIRSLTQGGKDDGVIREFSHDISGNEEEVIEVDGDTIHKTPEQRKGGQKLVAGKSTDNPMFIRENDSEGLEQMENELNQSTEQED